MSWNIAQSEHAEKPGFVKIIAMAAVVILLPLQTACATEEGGGTPEVQTASSDGLRAFQSDEELNEFLNRQRQPSFRRESNGYDTEGAVADGVSPAPPPSVAQAEEASTGEGITNNQTAGVDEGGIVKQRGDMLVVLRRGRIFTISTADGGMRAIDSINAFPPDASGARSWYDEMLIRGDRVIVIGYSYGRGGTEVSRFRLSEDGLLSFEDAHHLRSNDYYSAENYASRLIGDQLIFYTPLALGYGENALDALPGVKRWNGDETDRAFEPVAGPSQIFTTNDIFDAEQSNASALHSVTTCDVASDDFDCSAVGVIAGYSREFYVSGSAVYLWVMDGNPYARNIGEDAAQRYSHIFRIPLDGSQPSAIGARGFPQNQFSFREDDGVLNVLLRAGQGSMGMWEPEAPEGTISLLHVPLREFGDGSEEVRQRFYRHLGRTEGNVYPFENRFVGDHIVYGYGRAIRGASDRGARAFAARLSQGEATELAISHDVERIEILGSDAVIVGNGKDGSLGFSAIALAEATPEVADVFLMPAASQGESRSHAYFYRPDPNARDGASGTLGLPIARQVEPEFRRLLGSSAAMLFLRRDNRRFSAAGELAAQTRGVVDDNCEASCVDWYGNARPIFLGNRTFALMGYELVEGRMTGGRISEIGRLDYAPVSRDEPPAEDDPDAPPE